MTVEFPPFVVVATTSVLEGPKEVGVDVTTAGLVVLVAVQPPLQKVTVNVAVYSVVNVFVPTTHELVVGQRVV